MAKITKTEILTLSSRDAIALIKNADGKVRFSVKCAATLPIKDGETYFEGISFISISRKEAIRLVTGLLSKTLEARGGRIQLHLSAPDKPGDLSFISIY